MKSFPSKVPLHTLITRDIVAWRNSNSSKNRESLLSAVFEMATLDWAQVSLRERSVTSLATKKVIKGKGLYLQEHENYLN